MKTILNYITLYREIDEGGAMKNIMVFVAEFGWILEIIIFYLSYVKDVYFDM